MRVLKAFLWVVGFLIVVSIPIIIFQGKLTVNQTQIYVKSFGNLAPVIFILLISVTNVVPPMAATVFWITGIILFGPWSAFLYSYLGHLIGHSINYFIGWKWGRSTISKIAGSESLAEIDKFVAITKPLSILLIKITGGAATDYISYAAGLAHISFPVHVGTTMIGILPMMMLGFSLISKVGSDSLFNAAAALGIFYAINYTSTLLLIPIFWLIKKGTLSR